MCNFNSISFVGLHLEHYALNIDNLKNGQPWERTDDGSHVLKNRLVASNTGIAIFIIVALTQFFLFRRHSSKDQSKDIETTFSSTRGDFEENKGTEEKSNVDIPHDNTDKYHSRIIARYAMASAMMNSFLVGGVTFGYSGMVLILRKEGVYSDSCSCGSFW